MEMWEYVRRLLVGAAGGGQTFMPALIGGNYYRDLLAAHQTPGQPIHEFTDLADLFADQLLDAGLIRPAGVRNGSVRIVGAMERTGFGDEVCEALRRRESLKLFEETLSEINARGVRELLDRTNA